MPKSIDSIGPRPDKKQVKPVAEHKAGEVVRPKGAPTQAGEAIKPKNYEPPKKIESSVGKPQQPKKPVNKKKVVIFAGLVGVFALISIATIWVLHGTNLINSIGKPKPAAGNFAEVGDEIAKLEEYDAVKQAYEGFNKKQKSPDPSSKVAKQASKDVLEYLALKSAARQQEITCTQEIVDTRLQQRYADRGGKDAYYAYLLQEYGWSTEVTFLKECSEYLRDALAAKVVGGTDVFAVYIRWDQLAANTVGSEREAYEREAKARLERDFLPLFERGASQEEILKAADISQYTSDAEFDEKMKSPGSPYVRTMVYPKMNEATYAKFQQYPEGERDIDYINKLTVGEHTPVFKSNVGYFAIYRATAKSQGQYGSVDEIIQSLLNSGRYSNEYYSIPGNESETSPKIDLNNISQANPLDGLRNAMVSSAEAAGNVNCFTGVHSLPMGIHYRDYDTHQLIPLQQMRDNKGAAVATLGVTSTGDVQSPCSDEPPAINNAFGVMNIGYWAGFLNYDVYDHHINPWNFNLSCFTAWRFSFNKVYGYEPVNYSDASQFRVWLQTAGGIFAQQRASSNAGTYRIPSDLYHNIANGASGYAIEVFMRKEPPNPTCTSSCTPPTMTVSGFKQEENGTRTGPYRDNTITDTVDGVSNNGQPYSLSGLRADRPHSITPDPEPGYDVLGYTVGSDPTINFSTAYNYVSGSTGDGSTIMINWIYRAAPTVNLTVTCGRISGVINGGGSSEIEVYVSIAGSDLTDGSGQRILQGRNFNFIVPESYKDGIARTVQVRLIVDGVDIGVGTNGTGTLVCTRNAQCVSNNLATIFPNGRATLSTGDSEGNIKVGMQNNGQAIWATYPSGSYRLGLTAESREFWEINSSAVSGRIYPTPAASGTVDSLEFAPSLTLIKAPSDASTPLVFTMEFVPSDGSAPIAFGGTCGTSIRVLSSYGPWLRTQNGNVSAIGKIQGQEALSATSGNLGGRRDANAVPAPPVDGQRDDLNLEVTYLVMSHVAGNGPFCSTNAYVLGRDEADGTSFYPDGCDFDQYKFNLRSGLADALSALNPTEEVVYRNAEDAWDEAPDDCPAAGPATSGSARYKKGLDRNYNGQNLPVMSSACPEITKLTVARAGYLTLGTTVNPSPASTPALFQPTGRMTIIVDGNLYLNANVINTPKDATFNRDDMIGLNALPNLGILVKGDIIIDKDVTRIDASLYASGKIRTCEELYSPGATGNDNPLTSNGFKSETLSGGTVQQNSQAARCKNQLSVRGVMASKGGFMFGRNFVDFSGIHSHTGRAQFSTDFDYDTRRSLYYGKPAEDVIFNGLMLIAPPPGFEHLTKPDFTQARYVTDNADPRF